MAQVSMLRWLVVANEVLVIIRPIIVHYYPDLLLYRALVCQFYYSLLQPAVSEVIIFILSIQVKEFNPKPNLRIDAIFLIILIAVLFLGEFSLPCLIICALIIILFEAMHIRRHSRTKIVMKNRKIPKESKFIIQAWGPIGARPPLETPPPPADLLKREAEIREYYNQCVNNSKLITETSHEDFVE
uniref:Transmembrane domain-containing protein n=2 Tax=Caenorhabditis tropicalis TaxID=1561998 RepID=A0A1I7UYP6_9PELO